MKQDPPFAIQIELTKGCNLQCSFCGINGFQEKPNKKYNYMTLETARLMAEQIAFSGWNSRLEFAMHGEPTMNPNWIDIIAVFREHLPKHQIMVTSNGGGIVMSKDIQTTIESYFECGGTILALDEYEGINLINKIKNKVDDFALEDMGVVVRQYPEDREGNPHRRIKGKLLSFISPINLNKNGTHASLNNHCGSGGPLDHSQNNKRCAKPFREMSLNWDGSVNLCCNDFIDEYRCGDIHSQDIEDIWNNKYFNSARKFLMVPNRNSLRPCRGCNAKSYRVGLLPDKFGKINTPKPTKEDKDIVLEALQHGPVSEVTPRAKLNIIPTLDEDEAFIWE